jgi:hypothetical protein
MDCSAIPKDYDAGEATLRTSERWAQRAHSILVQPSESEFDNGMRKLWRHCRIAQSSGVRGG